ncbi:MAG: hypothetical protein ACLTZT_02775 [Butyricimonas faecalis]
MSNYLKTEYGLDLDAMRVGPDYKVYKVHKIHRMLRGLSDGSWLSKDTRGFMNFVNRTDNQLMFNKINVCYESFAVKMIGMFFFILFCGGRMQAQFKMMPMPAANGQALSALTRR